MMTLTRGNVGRCCLIPGNEWFVMYFYVSKSRYDVQLDMHTRYLDITGDEDEGLNGDTAGNTSCDL